MTTRAAHAETLKVKQAANAIQHRFMYGLEGDEQHAAPTLQSDTALIDALIAAVRHEAGADRLHPHEDGADNDQARLAPASAIAPEKLTNASTTEAGNEREPMIGVEPQPGLCNARDHRGVLCVKVAGHEAPEHRSVAIGGLVSEWLSVPDEHYKYVDRVYSAVYEELMKLRVKLHSVLNGRSDVDRIVYHAQNRAASAAVAAVKRSLKAEVPHLESQITGLTDALLRQRHKYADTIKYAADKAAEAYDLRFKLQDLDGTHCAIQQSGEYAEFAEDAAPQPPCGKCLMCLTSRIKELESQVGSGNQATQAERAVTPGRSASAIKHLQSTPPEDEQTDQARSGHHATSKLDRE